MGNNILYNMLHLAFRRSQSLACFMRKYSATVKFVTAVSSLDRGHTGSNRVGQVWDFVQGLICSLIVRVQLGRLFCYCTVKTPLCWFVRFRGLGALCFRPTRHLTAHRRLYASPSGIWILSSTERMAWLTQIWGRNSENDHSNSLMSHLGNFGVAGLS